MFTWLRTLIVLLVLTACASGPKVRVDTDPRIDMKQYKTFVFIEPIATDGNSQYTMLVTTRLKQATQYHMERLGYKLNKDGKPCLLINFWLKTSRGQRIYSTTGSYSTYPYGTWVGYPYINTYDYQEGALTIDLIDANRKRLVWRGVAEGDEITAEAMESPGPALDKVVAKIFSNFPLAPKK